VLCAISCAYPGDRTSSQGRGTIDAGEGRNLGEIPAFKIEGGLKTYLKSCTPAELRMDKFTVLQFEVHKQLFNHLACFCAESVVEHVQFDWIDYLYRSAGSIFHLVVDVQACSVDCSNDLWVSFACSFPLLAGVSSENELSRGIFAGHSVSVICVVFSAGLLSAQTQFFRNDENSNFKSPLLIQKWLFYTMDQNLVVKIV
jgi:hypothetical protein